jgi:hypothetical protein
MKQIQRNEQLEADFSLISEMEMLQIYGGDLLKFNRFLE